MRNRLAEVRERLRNAGILEALQPYNPTMAGTFPIGLDTAASDVDILCEIRDAEAFVDDVRRRFGTWAGFRVHRKTDVAPPAVVCRFSVDDLPIEVFAQPLAVLHQRAYRHLVVEQRLLAVGGAAFHADLRALRLEGLKTEPAFALYLDLEGDPYEALLQVAEWSDAELAELVGRARSRRTGPE